MELSASPSSSDIGEAAAWCGTKQINQAAAAMPLMTGDGHRHAAQSSIISHHQRSRRHVLKVNEISIFR